MNTDRIIACKLNHKEGIKRKLKKSEIAGDHKMTFKMDETVHKTRTIKVLHLKGTLFSNSIY
jgi:hypothetical protein